MKEIFEYLKQHCLEDDSFFRPLYNELVFKFSNFDIVIEFDELEEESYIFPSAMTCEKLSKEKIYRIYIRDGIIPLNNDEDNYEWEEFPENNSAYTYNMYVLMNLLNKKYPGCISDYEVNEFLYDSCDYCDDLYIDGFKIDIDKDLWTNLAFFEYLVNVVNNNIQYLSIPEFIKIRNELKDSFEIRILNSNTKIRRLGYLKILLNMLKEQPKMPISKINTKFEKYCQNYSLYLEVHKNKKGNVIVTKTGNSANPYIELAVSLGLIHKAAGIYQIGKTGKVYNILKSKIDNFNENPFEFSKFDVTFFLELLLKEDYWFLYAIMEQAAIVPNIAYKTLKKDFKLILLKQISRFIDEAGEDNTKKVLPLKLTERRINEWKKPEVYMEHILMPRLNWLYDMDLIELKNDLSFSLTEIGKCLLFNLATWNDIALRKIVSPNAYIDNYFIKVINNVFDLKGRKYSKATNDELYKCLENSFMLFKTIAPNRITFSLFATYTKHVLFWDKSILIDTEDIKKIFESKEVTNYIFKYQEQYKDGYIQKLK